MKIVNLRLDERVVKKLDEISSKLLVSRSEVIRQALTLYISLIENIGFYFKPSVFSPKFDIYEERNSLSIDLGNNLSLSVFSLSYGGIGEKEWDWLKSPLERVAEIMAFQIRVECICRFTKPLAVMISTGNELEYTSKFLRLLKKYLRTRILLSENEEIAKTRQSFFNAIVIGWRDMNVKNIPRRGDKIFLYGEILNGEDLLQRDLPDIRIFKFLAEKVKKREANSIAPVKGDGLLNACLYLSSIAGGRLKFKFRDKGCPATAVLVTSEEMPMEGGVEVGEIL